ncbi:hypothetical protein FB45DRAFT_1031964 [Roridomyces roridus]|uniref:Uncharacterized protein n=1 Tax=Roridomyces roridus TaxID=1738132 RepID=A0AAD7BIP1_9AGAR|nr:hypothetical protein FB45DRAFT_1031964 [Roridomyces roridus]
MQRSACKLTALVLTRCSTTEGLLPFLTACPSIEQLVLETLGWADTIAVPDFTPFFDALRVSDANPATICANLAFFALGWTFGTAGFASMEDSMFHMMRSRFLDRLRSVRLLRKSGMALWFGEHFIQQLQDDGLDIKYVAGGKGQDLIDQLVL